MFFQHNYEQYIIDEGVNFPAFENRDPFIADNKFSLELVISFKQA